MSKSVAIEILMCLNTHAKMLYELRYRVLCESHARIEDRFFFMVFINAGLFFRILIFFIVLLSKCYVCQKLFPIFLSEEASS